MNGTVATPPRLTTTDACPRSGASNGTWKLIWLGETYQSGALNPPTETSTSPKVAGSGTADANVGVSPRLTPNIDATEPREMPGLNPAALTIPLALIDGAVMPPGAFTMTTESVAVALGPPPPEMLTMLTCGEAAFGAMFTITVIAG